MRDTASAEEELPRSAAQPRGSRQSFAFAVLRALRPRQWVKNGFVLAPLFFSRRFFEWELCVAAAIAVALFCAASSGIYLLNDLADREADRLHPTKRFRPIASGQLPVPVAWFGAVSLTCAAAALSFWMLGSMSGAIVATYVAMNVVYSFWVKHLAYLDAMTISAGFGLRVAAGAYATAIPVSPYLWGMTMLLALYLAFGKRYHELKHGNQAVRRRRALRGYRIEALRLFLALCAGGVFFMYVAYSFSQHAWNVFGTKIVPVTIPFVAFGIWRFWHLASSATILEPPTDAMLRDRLFLLNGALWVACFAAMLS